MLAILIKDEYPDLAMGYPYEIEKVYNDGHIKLKGSPRRYTGSSFKIMHNDKKISTREAYRQQQLGQVKRKLGLK